jgi:hypothetical protein
MRFNERRIRATASDVPPHTPPKASERLRSFKAFVAAEQAHLLERHRFGLGGREIARGRADLVDVVVSRA